MSVNSPKAHNIEFLQKQAKKLVKQFHSHDPEVASLLHAAHPGFVGVPNDQLFSLDFRLGDAKLALARQHGFPSWNHMTAYVTGRPRRENGGIVISEKPGLTLEEALNDRASLHGMPHIGAVTTNVHGIEWQVVDYDFFPTPSTFARYPNDCDYLPIVAPRNASQRLKDFMAETDRCTSKRILFVDTMPDNHPFKLGQDIHCANFGGNPEESYIFLDAAHAHETTFAHELGHLWMTYVEGGDGSRTMRDRSDNGKINQLDFVQSFVLDLAVNDLITSRGFDMSLINNDQITSLTALRDAFVLGYKPPTAREALLNSLTIAGAVLEQKRWPDKEKERLVILLDFFAAVAPGIYRLAEQFVEVIHRHGYERKEARRLGLDECITLGFRATGDDFDIERDLQEPSLTECMQDKYPEQFAGLPVPLKLEIGKTMARHGISGDGNVHLAADRMGRARIMVETDEGEKIGPLCINYQLIPYNLTTDFREMGLGPRVISGNTLGRLPSGPPLANSLPQMPALVNGQIPDQFGRLPGDPGYNTAFPPCEDPASLMNATPQRQADLSRPYNPWKQNDGLKGHFYMAGVGLSVARARLMQQMAGGDGSILDANPYVYALNNPVNYTDPSGDVSIPLFQKPPPIFINLPNLGNCVTAAPSCIAICGGLWNVKDCHQTGNHVSCTCFGPSPIVPLPPIYGPEPVPRPKPAPPCPPPRKTPEECKKLQDDCNEYDWYYAGSCWECWRFCKAYGYWPDDKCHPRK